VVQAVNGFVVLVAAKVVCYVLPAAAGVGGFVEFIHGHICAGFVGGNQPVILVNNRDIENFPLAEPQGLPLPTGGVAAIDARICAGQQGVALGVEPGDDATGQTIVLITDQVFP